MRMAARPSSGPKGEVLRLGLIGYGAIGRMVADDLRERPVAGIALASVLVRAAYRDEAQGSLPEGTTVATSAAQLLGTAPTLVVEAAGQDAAREYVVDILRAGVDVLIVSTGALADGGFRVACETAARETGARLIVPAGAIAGLDGLLAMRRAGLDRVRYTSTKPPKAWKGTLAETLVDLDRLTEAREFYRGPAAEAALKFPQNANLAATVALASAGLERTEIALVADPAAIGNTGHVEAEGRFGTLTIRMSGRSMPGNPKTSAITAMSILAYLENAGGAIQVF